MSPRDGGARGRNSGMTLAQEETRELHRIATEELSALPRGISDIHDAISGRVFRSLGPSARPVERFHKAVSQATYGAVSGGLKLAVGAAGRAAGVPETPLSETP